MTEKKRKLIKHMKPKVPFPVRHPKLNLIIGFFIFFLLVAVSVGIILIFARFMGELFEKTIHFLKETVSKLDAVIIVALITGGVSITGVVFSSIVSKILEFKQKRREYLYQKREEPYEDFINVVYKVQELAKAGRGYSNEEMLSDMMSFSQKLTLWGSNRVIKKWLKFKSTSANTENSTELLFVLEDILFAMRKDMGLKRLGKGKLLSFFVNDIDKYKSSKGK